MLLDHIIWIGAIWLVTFFAGLASLPVARKLFAHSSDRGYIAAKACGIFVVSYALFLLATLRVLPLHRASIIALLFVWAGVNVWMGKRQKYVFKDFASLRHIIIIECTFLLFLAGFVLIKSFQPEIYQIERFMDYGFMEALRNSVWLPLESIWFAGETLNYYYFGHVIGYVLLELTQLTTTQGFFILQAWIFALLSLLVFQFGRDIANTLLNHASQAFKKYRKLLARTAGLLSIFATVFAGSWHSAPWLAKYVGSKIGLHAAITPFHYPAPTRIMPGTITEMPIYSFLVADLHAHVWDLLTGIVLLLLLFNAWKSRYKRPSPRIPHAWAAVFLLGIAYMTNSWDALTLGLLTVTIMWFMFPQAQFGKKVIVAGLLATSSYIVALPWSLSFKAPIQGFGIVHDQSPFWPWLSYWGPLVFVGLLIIAAYFRAKQKDRPAVMNYIFPILITAGFFIVLVEVFYVSDILREGEWFRANTLFKVSIQLWVWLASLTGPAFIAIFASLQKKWSRTIMALILTCFIAVGVTYPIIAIKQSYIAHHTLSGVDSGLMWWQNKYPSDYRAYQYLLSVRSVMPGDDRMRTIVEAEGDSYTDISRFSVFLGWPTIVGWPVHEWTWRGSYDEVGARRDEVRELYIGTNPSVSAQILKKYNVSYIIVGQVERDTYKQDLKISKLRDLGSIIFDDGTTFIVATQFE